MMDDLFNADVRDDYGGNIKLTFGGECGNASMLLTRAQCTPQEVVSFVNRWLANEADYLIRRGKLDSEGLAIWDTA